MSSNKDKMCATLLEGVALKEVSVENYNTQIRVL
jgi:hypothetical protein